jgi:hypothetical protein
VKSQVYRVVYDRRTPGWQIEMDGRRGPLTGAITKTEAIELALKLGRSAEIARVFIHRRDGTVEIEHSFDDAA